MVPSTCDVLLVEDSFDDAFFLSRAWSAQCDGYSIFHVSDGEKAKQFLLGEGMYASVTGRALPRCIICDLKMPYCDGLQLTRWVKQSSQFRGIAVIVLSSSPLDSDVAAAFEAGAAGYFVKPKSSAGYLDLVRELEVYWKQ